MKKTWDVIKIEKWFTWAGFQWFIPAIYVCEKGLVVDFCRRIEKEQYDAFVQKWNLDIDSTLDDFTKKEQMMIIAENPMLIHMKPVLILNGKELQPKGSSGTSYQPWLQKNIAHEVDEMDFMEHYGLDTSYGWEISRQNFSWADGEREAVKTLQIVMEQKKVQIPGKCFQVKAPGEQVKFRYPENGQEYTLTVQTYAERELDEELVAQAEYKFPTHFYELGYTIEPDIPEGLVKIEDCEESDSAKSVVTEHRGAKSICIIGGADGPTSVFIAGKFQRPKYETAYSSVHFEKCDKVEWQIVFNERQFEPMVIDFSFS